MSLSRRAALAGLAATVTMTPSLAEAATKIITGTVSYRERVSLPKGARVEVELVDVSLADAPSRTLARAKIRPRAMPFSYRLRVGAATIQPRHSYALQVRITLGDRLLYTTTTRHTVFGAGPDQTDITVERVAAHSEAPSEAPTGRWLARSVSGETVSADIRPTLDIQANGTVGGKSGCNSFGGEATITGDRIVFGKLRSTLMACAPPALAQEQRFVRALERARRWNLSGGGQQLTLLDEAGASLAVFGRA